MILITAIEGLRVEDKNNQSKRKVGWSETDSNGPEVNATSAFNLINGQFPKRLSKVTEKIYVFVVVGFLQPIIF